MPNNNITQFQLLRGSSGSNAAYIGRPGELTADMQNFVIRLHDGTTPGGYIIAGGGGGGGVTSVTAGTGLTASPNPITSTGTISLSTSITASLFGTSSRAQTSSISVSSSFATSASYALSSSYSLTSSRAISASSANNAVSSSYALTGSYAITSSYAVTSSRAISSVQIDVLGGGSSTATGIYSGSFSGSFFGSLSGSSGTGAGFPFSGSAVITGSLVVSSSGLYLSGSGLTGSVLGTSSWAQSSSVAVSALSSSYALTSSRAISSAQIDVLGGGSTTAIGTYSGSFSGSFFGSLSGGTGAGFPFSGSAVITGSLLISSSGIYLSGSGLTGSVLGTSSWANNAVSSSYATTASYVLAGTSVTQIEVLSGGSTTATGSYSGSLFGTASYALNGGSGGGVTINNNTDNYLVTATGTANTLNGESTVTLDGTTFTANTTNFVVNSSNITVGNDLTDIIGIGNNTVYVSSSKVGIGTTSPSEKFEVYAGGLSVNSGTIKTVISYASTGIIGTTTNHNLALYTNNTAKATIDTSGNVGIGSTSPQAKFHINGGDFLRTNTDYVASSAGSGFVITPGASSGNTYTQIYAFSTGNTAYANLIIPGGNVGIGTVSPGATLHVQGSISGSSLTLSGNATAADFILSSDRRKKTELLTIDSGLSKVTTLVGYTYKPIDNDRRRAGLMAQDVEEILPEAVYTDENGYKSLSYEQVIPLLVEAIKELNIKVKTLEQRLVK